MFRWVLTSLVASLKENHHPFLKIAEDEVGYLLDKETVGGYSVKIRHDTMYMVAQCIFIEWMTSLADRGNIALWTEMQYIPYSRQASSREAPP